MRPMIVRLALLATMMAAASGCAGLGRLSSSTVDIDAQQEQRAAEALESFETKRDDAQLMAAQARWREGNLKACRQGLEELLARDPTHLESRALLIQVLLSEEKYDLARGYLDQVLAERPADAKAHHTMGLVLQLQGSETKALAYYRRAAEIQPENKEYALSCAVMEGFCQATPDQCGATQDGVQACAACAVDADASQADAVAARPDVEQALDDAHNAIMSDDVQKARDLLTKAVSLDTQTPRVAIRAAVLALRQRHPELAIFVLQPLAERFNDSAALHRTLGTAYYRHHDYQDALSALEQALSLDNSNALSYLLLGCTLEKLGQSETAKTHLEQAGRLDPRLRVQR
jgi:tetratricopeptide (TPR) repeat protein